mmetsp:Transcript_95793/g.285959  ORF Transcript_95793/g.285959 Transcript_95793/m.285959 type:complete len:203 (-) Transcript_95793:868-1476(-)
MHCHATPLEQPLVRRHLREEHLIVDVFHEAEGVLGHDFLHDLKDGLLRYRGPSTDKHNRYLRELHVHEDLDGDLRSQGHAAPAHVGGAPAGRHRGVDEVLKRLQSLLPAKVSQVHHLGGSVHDQGPHEATLEPLELLLGQVLCLVKVVGHQLGGAAQGALLPPDANVLGSIAFEWVHAEVLLHVWTYFLHQILSMLDVFFVR